MNPRKLVVGTAAAGGGLILLTTVLFKDEIHDWLYAIRRVRTWGDLLAQRPIHLSDGVVVRLGVEDTLCPQGSGVLLYCLTEGYDPKSTGEVGDDCLGPLEVRIVGASGGSGNEYGFATKKRATLRLRKERTTPSGIRGKEVPERSSSAPLLFVRAVPVPVPGEHRFNILEGRNEIGYATVEGTHDSLHPWMVIEASSQFQTLLRTQEGQVSTGSLGSIVPGGGWVALPSWRGHVPYRAPSAKGLLDPILPLPRLLPEASARRELDLRMQGHSVVLTSKSKLRSYRENFAARWWVNGQPHVPQRIRNPEGILGGLSTHNEGFRLELDLAVSRLAAVAGDRVSLQLMYSDRGWTSMDGDEFFSSPSSEEHRVLESNRIELTVR